MGKSREKKLFHFIKYGKLNRVRSLLKKQKSSGLTDITDRQGRTPLHISCLVGNNAIMRVLLKNGADVEAVDSKGNTPLHLALKYAIETGKYSTFTDLIVPLLNICGSHILDLRNNKGKTSREYLSLLQGEYDQQWEETRAQRKQQKGMDNTESLKKEEDLEWERKLCFEAGQEDFSKYHDEEGDMETIQETYDEWVERIMHERQQKIMGGKQRTETDTKKKYQEQEWARKKTRQLEKEHEAYITQKSQECRKSKLVAALTEYENHCHAVFDTETTRTLKFIDVPWPCMGETCEMINLVKIWSTELKSVKERKMFLKEQQIRWHPDRFLQKCGNRLDSEESDKITEQVKALSQEINSLVDEIVAQQQNYL